jgi:hypothetical protein
MAFLHAAPPSCSFTVKNANCCRAVPAANFEGNSTAELPGEIEKATLGGVAFALVSQS